MLQQVEMQQKSDFTAKPWVFFNIYDHIVNQKFAPLLFEFIATVAVWWPHKTCVKSDIWIQYWNKVRQNETDRQASIVRYLFEQPRERWFSDAVKCVYGIEAERREEKVNEKKKEADGGRERWEEWRLICGSHGPEKELLVLTRLTVCMCGYLCVIRVPQSAETKGVSRHLLSPPKHDTPPQRETREKKKGGRNFHLSLPPTIVTVCACVCLTLSKTETVL